MLAKSFLEKYSLNYVLLRNSDGFVYKALVQHFRDPVPCENVWGRVSATCTLISPLKCRLLLIKSLVSRKDRLMAHVGVWGF